MQRIKILALFGPSAAGKDTTLNKIMEIGNGFHRIVPTTTRKPRNYQEDGVDYYFIDDEQFNEHRGNMFGTATFNGWHYGYNINNLQYQKINVGVFNIYALRQIIKDQRFDVKAVFIHADAKTRLMRSITRERSPNCVEICRRFLADIKDYEAKPEFPYIFVDTQCQDYLDIVSNQEIVYWMADKEQPTETNLYNREELINDYNSTEERRAPGPI